MDKIEQMSRVLAMAHPAQSLGQTSQEILDLLEEIDPPQHAWKMGGRKTWCGEDRNEADSSHRASGSPEEADSRPLCIKCYRAVTKYWSERSGRRSTHWLPISEIGWVDRITGKARRECDKKIEVVVHHGEILVSDDESGTHRMIPTDNILDFRFGVFE